MKFQNYSYNKSKKVIYLILIKYKKINKNNAKIIN